MKATLDGITWHLRKCEHCDGTGYRRSVHPPVHNHQPALLACRDCHETGMVRSLTGEAAAQYQREWRARNEHTKKVS